MHAALGVASTGVSIEDPMSRHSAKDPNEPIEDFVDMQEHRYDPGFWPSQWYKRQRYDPVYNALRKARLSAFYRTLLMMAFVLPIETMFFEEYGPTSGKGAAAYVVLGLGSFFILWWLIHLAMSRSARKASNE